MSRRNFYTVFLRKKGIYVVDLRNRMPKLTQEFCDRYWIGGHLNAMGYLFKPDTL